MILWLHPIWQTGATLLGIYVLALGWKRVQSRHLRQKTVFPWQEHVRWGRRAIGLWLSGAILGLAVARLEWGGFLITGGHAWTGIVFGLLALFGYVSGHIMDTKKKPRTALPVAHGIINLCLVGMALWQAWSGRPFLP